MGALGKTQILSFVLGFSSWLVSQEAPFMHLGCGSETEGFGPYRDKEDERQEHKRLTRKAASHSPQKATLWPAN